MSNRSTPPPAFPFSSSSNSRRSRRAKLETNTDAASRTVQMVCASARPSAAHAESGETDGGGKGE